MSLGKNASVKRYIDDFIKSKDSRFKGDSKKKRIQRALAAYYAKHEEVNMDKDQLDELRRGTLGNYIVKASKRVRASSSLAKEFEQGAHQAAEKGDKAGAAGNEYASNLFKNSAKRRLKGIETATKKLVKSESWWGDQKTREKAVEKMPFKDMHLHKQFDKWKEGDKVSDSDFSKMVTKTYKWDRKAKAKMKEEADVIESETREPNKSYAFTHRGTTHYVDNVADEKEGREELKRRLAKDNKHGLVHKFKAKDISDEDRDDKYAYGESTELRKMKRGNNQAAKAFNQDIKSGRKSPWVFKHKSGKVTPAGKYIDNMKKGHTQKEYDKLYGKNEEVELEEKKVYQDGPDFYDSHSGKVIKSYKHLVKGDSDMEGAKKAREQFKKDHPDHVFESAEVRKGKANLNRMIARGRAYGKKQNRDPDVGGFNEKGKKFGKSLDNMKKDLTQKAYDKAREKEDRFQNEEKKTIWNDVEKGHYGEKGKRIVTDTKYEAKDYSKYWATRDRTDLSRGKPKEGSFLKKAEDEFEKIMKKKNEKEGVGKMKEEQEIYDIVSQLDEISKKTLASYLKKNVRDREDLSYAHGQDPDEYETGTHSNPRMNQHTYAKREKGFNTALKKLSKTKNEEAEYTRPIIGAFLYDDLEEGRGRPRKNPDDPKWKTHASASSSDEHDYGGKDSGREPDQHIHVQLKAAADMKPGADSKGGAHVTFGDGSKHFVKHDVAHKVTSAIEKLHPKHREAVHNMIAKSHENLMAVHSAIGKGGK